MYNKSSKHEKAYYSIFLLLTKKYLKQNKII